MRGRATLTVGLLASAVALPVAARSQSTPPADTGADFFRTTILGDAKTTTAVKNLLTSKAGFVDPASQYGDLTGDGKPDAAVRIDTGGAAGAVALYVFTAEGSKAGKLRIVYRNQQQYRVTAKIAGSTLTLSRPVWAKGDDVCCPSQLREQDYAWDAKARTMVRQGAARTT
jgi:hypothetical protein